MAQLLHCGWSASEGSPARLLIFRPGAIGDTLLCLPALAELRRLYPGATLTFAGNAAVLALLQEISLADKVFSFDDLRWAGLFSASARSQEHSQILREEFSGAELVVLWLRDSNGLIAQRCQELGTKQVICAPGRPPDRKRHTAAYLLASLKAAGLAVRVPPPSAPPIRRSFPPFPLLRPPAAVFDWTDQFWQRHGLTTGSVVMVHPGSGGLDKCWPAPRFAALLDWLDQKRMRTVLSAGPADRNALDGVQAYLETAQPALLSDVTLEQLAAVLQRCAAFVGNDSGISHLSAMLGVPTVTLFGPTDAWVWAPLGPAVQTLSAESLGHISLADVIAALRDLLPEVLS